MNKKLLSILLFFNFWNLSGQIDSIEMSDDQFIKFQSIINDLDSLILSEDQVYENDARFDSLIEVAENLDSVKKYEKSEKVYLEEKRFIHIVVF